MSKFSWVASAKFGNKLEILFHIAVIIAVLMLIFWVIGCVADSIYQQQQRRAEKARLQLMKRMEKAQQQQQRRADRAANRERINTNIAYKLNAIINHCNKIHIVHKHETTTAKQYYSFPSDC